MMHLSMAEQIAYHMWLKATASPNGPGGSTLLPFDLQPDHDFWLEMAKIALATARKPNRVMLEAGCAAHPLGGYNTSTSLVDIIEAEWIAMVDEASR